MADDTHTKGKERKSIYIAPFAPRYTQSAQAWITQLYPQTTPCLPFLRGVHQMAPPQQLRQQTSNCSSLLIYRPQKDERLSWPSWLNYSGWLTRISGQPSATGRAQDSESTSAKDQCSTAGPCNQHSSSSLLHSPTIHDEFDACDRPISKIGAYYEANDTTVVCRIPYSVKVSRDATQRHT